MALLAQRLPVVGKNDNLPELTPEQNEALARAKQYAVQESVKHVLAKQQAQAQKAMESVVAAHTLQTGQPVGNEAMFLQKQQALVLMCRVYVGSIYYDLKEEIIRNAFAPFGPFKSINMSFDPVTGKHKGFAFIEYECPEAAQLALEQMGGVMLGGRSIKVGRPANMPQSHPAIDMLLEEAKSQKRVYVSSVHTDLNTDDLKSVFSAFGNITSCTLVNDPVYGKHKGYGFIEYDTLQSANDAVASMNLFDLGGQYLRVGKAIAPAGVTIPAGSSFNNNPINQVGSTPASATPSLPPVAPILQPVVTTNVSKFTPQVVQLPQQAIPPPVFPPPGIYNPATSIPPPGIAVNPMLGGTQQVMPPKEMELPNTLSAQEDMKLSGVEARHMVMQRLMRKEKETRVMILRNMVDAQDIDEDLESEVTEECGKFGAVNRVVIYQEKQGEEDTAPVIVKIFVEFNETGACQAGMDALNGRWFGGRKIEATPYPQHKFDSNDLSG